MITTTNSYKIKHDITITVTFTVIDHLPLLHIISHTISIRQWSKEDPQHNLNYNNNKKRIFAHLQATESDTINFNERSKKLLNDQELTYEQTREAEAFSKKMTSIITHFF